MQPGAYVVLNFPNQLWRGFSFPNIICDLTGGATVFTAPIKKDHWFYDELSKMDQELIDELFAIEGVKTVILDDYYTIRIEVIPVYAYELNRLQNRIVSTVHKHIVHRDTYATEQEEIAATQKLEAAQEAQQKKKPFWKRIR